MNSIKSVVLVSAIIETVLLLSGCGNIKLGESIESKNIDGNKYTLVERKPTQTDTKTSYENIIKVDVEQLDDNKMKGISYEAGEVRITDSGVYELSGKLSGRIRVCIPEDENIVLQFNNLEVASPSGSAVYVTGAGKTVITLVEGSDNRLSDTAHYNPYEEDADACLYVENNLSINGEGRLYIRGAYKDAISSKDIIKIISGRLHVIAQKDGIKGRDGVEIYDGEIDIETEECGIRASNANKIDLGYIFLSGGKISIISGKNAMKAESVISVHSCDFSAKSVFETFKCKGIKDIDEDCIENGK